MIHFSIPETDMVLKAPLLAVLTFYINCVSGRPINVLFFFPIISNLFLNH